MTASYRLVAVVEGPSDIRRLRPLVRSAVERMTLDRELHWFQDADPDEIVALCGARDGEEYFDIHHVAAFEEQVLGARVKYGGPLGSGEARQLERFVRALMRLRPAGVDGLIWLHDTDGDTRRPAALCDARDRLAARYPTLRIAVGCPHQAMEAWVVCGFVPGSPAERGALASLHAEIHFDPLCAPERLLHQDGHPHSGKRVVALLCSDHDREHTVIAVALEAQEHIQWQVGLRAFVDELDQRILTPLLVP